MFASASARVISARAVSSPLQGAARRTFLTSGGTDASGAPIHGYSTQKVILVSAFAAAAGAEATLYYFTFFKKEDKDENKANEQVKAE
ncbi:hypothetical protein BGW38_005551 [Lunasporangiospora selenospora]|uniref:Uncharacterized protein n=1 Tax=Lunasporangiospora selenospora TaxID=979761 RepID=A0A9P6FZH7_9FUNG|nr:hypothetical protein BGW38_005551 [Lunasporangiospora selenospora]